MTIACAACKKQIQESQSNYNDAGEQVCDSCFEQEDLQKNMLKGFHQVASGSFSVSVLSFFFNPFFILSIIAISSGLQTIRIFFSKEKDYVIDAKGQAGYLILACLGILIGLLPFVQVFLALALGTSATQQ
ncbi:hypothetical protein L6R29_05700 [Myxococcota bacterium]|nr:hypothetical protein [Myxococcota bacterium]